VGLEVDGGVVDWGSTCVGFKLDGTEDEDVDLQRARTKVARKKEKTGISRTSGFIYIASYSDYVSNGFRKEAVTAKFDGKHERCHAPGDRDAQEPDPIVSAIKLSN
jgi:hypothetical protein